MPNQYKVAVAVAHSGPGTAGAVSSTGEGLKAVVNIQNLGRAFKAKPKPGGSGAVTSPDCSAAASPSVFASARSSLTLSASLGPRMRSVKIVCERQN